MLERVEQVLVSVADLDAATATWARALGVPPVWRGEHAESGTEHALFRFENAGLALLAPAAAGAGANGRGEHEFCAALRAHGEGVFGLVFGVDDAAACAREIEARGLAPSAPQPGLARDVESGAFQRWLSFALPPASTRGARLYAVQMQTPDALPDAQVDDAAAVCAVDHIVLRTRAPAATRALYAGALGLRLALEREAREWGAHMQFFRAGGVTLEVVAPLAAPAASVTPASPAPAAPDVGAAAANVVAGAAVSTAADAGAEKNSDSKANAGTDSDTDNFWGIAFRVSSADAACERVRAAGWRASDVRAGRKPGTRVFHLRDAKLGVPVLFIEQPR